MHSSFTLVFLSLLISNLSWSVFAGNYPIVGVVLLQSAPQSEAFGTVSLIQQNEGAPIVVEGLIFNLKPNSQFGLHVHEQGDLTNACKSAGGHFNPYGQQHGSERSAERHWGDLGNIASDGLGNARVLVNVPQGSLIGADGYIGRALVLHEREDDLGLTNNELSKKTGDSGSRIACGVIGIRQPTGQLPFPQQQQQQQQQTQLNTNSQRSSSFVPTFRQQAQSLRTM